MKKLANVKIKLNKRKKEITIENLVIKNPEVFNFLEDKKDIDYWIEKSLSVGCIGLKQMVLTDNVDFVEKAFNRFLDDAKKTFEKQTITIDEKLKSIFDTDNKKSMVSKFKIFLDEHKNDFDMNNSESLFAKFKEFMELQSSNVDETLDRTFSLDDKKSSFSRFKKQLDETFNMKQEGSPLNQFKELIVEYFDKRHGTLKETMQEYFDEKEGKIKYLLDSAFDTDNKKSSFSKLLKEIKENTDIEEEKIQELLDPNKTNSPMKFLKDCLFEKFQNLKDEDLERINEKIKELRENEIKEIRDEVLKNKNIENEKSKGTQKGFDFEEEVHEKLEEIASLYEDKVTDTGNKISGKGKVGDICIDLNCNSKNRVVIECKDSNSYKGSVKKTTGEILSAIKNRNGSFGVMIFANPEQIPPALRPIKITDKYIVTSFSDQNIYFTYRLFRLLLLRESNNQNDEIDFEKLSSEFVIVEDKIKTIEGMQSKATNIINSGNYIHQNLGSLRSDVEISLAKIKSILGDEINENSIQNNDMEELSNGAEVSELSMEEDEEVSGRNEDYQINCPICKKDFVSKIKQKKFCSYTCSDKFKRIKSVKNLTLVERTIKEELMEKGLL